MTAEATAPMTQPLTEEVVSSALSPRPRPVCRSYFGEFGPSPSDENEAFRSRLSPDGAELERMSYSDEECVAVAKMWAFFEAERPELPNRRHREQMPHAFPRL